MNPGSSEHFSSDALPIGCFAIMEWNSSCVGKRVVPGWRVSAIISGRKDYGGHIRNSPGKKQILLCYLSSFVFLSHVSEEQMTLKSKVTLSIKNNAGVIKYPKFKIYHRAMKAKPEWYCQRNGHEDQWIMTKVYLTCMNLRYIGSQIFGIALFAIENNEVSPLAIKNGIMSSARKWIKLNAVMLTKVKPSPKDSHHMISLICRN